MLIHKWVVHAYRKSDILFLINFFSFLTYYLNTKRHFRLRWLTWFYLTMSTGFVHIYVPFTLLRDDRLPKYGCFFGKFPNGLDPRPFLEITLRFFAKVHKYELTSAILQWNFLDWRWPLPPFFDIFFQNLRPKYTALKPTKSAM